ncbi:MAG: oligosaccharide flippase family protein [Brumimicrobium sp.]
MFKIISVLKKNLFQGFAVYLGTSVIKKAIPFFLLPILTRYLSTEEYGILAIYQVFISFGMPVVGMNMQTNITRNFFSKSKEFVARITFNLFIVLTASSAIFLLLISLYLLAGGPKFSIPDRWIFVLPLIAFTNMVNTFNLTILRNRKRAAEFGLFEISRTIVDLSITIILIVIYAFGWEGRATGILIGSLIIGILSVFRIWQSGYLLFEIDKSQIKEILKISLPLIPHVLGGAIITLGDRIFIDQMVSTSAVGIYTVGYQFGMIMTLVVMAFNKTWSPWMYELLAEEKKENKVTIVKATYLVSGVFIVLALVVTAISYYLLPFMVAEEYHGGFVFVIWIAMGYAFNGMYTLVFPYGVHLGKTSYLGVTTFTAAIINLVANYYLIGINGPLGAAQATLISYVIMFFTVWWYSNRLYKMPWFGKLNRQ